MSAGPLQAMLDSAIVSIGGQSSTQPLGILNYQGDPLFLHTGIANNTLTILVNTSGPGDFGPSSGTASSATITIAYGTDPVSPLTVQNLSYTAGPMVLNVRLTEDLSRAYVEISEGSRPVAGDGDAVLSFVIIEDDVDASKPLRLEWIDNVPQRQIVVQDYAHHQTGQTVEPVPVAGSVAGPMGILVGSP